MKAWIKALLHTHNLYTWQRPSHFTNICVTIKDGVAFTGTLDPNSHRYAEFPYGFSI